MKRMLKALCAFSLTLILVLSLGAFPLCAAAGEEETDAPFAGYLLILDPDATPQNDLPFGLFGQATLMAAEEERAGLLPIVEEDNIYRTNDLSEIRNLVWTGKVAVLEPDYKIELFDLNLADLANPNDDFFTTNYQYNLTQINVQSAWDAGLTGEGVTVAVIDSGLNVDHVDAPVKVGRGRYYFFREEANGTDFELNGKKYNFYSNDYIKDNLGHGSMVSGIIAANTNNRSGSYTGGVAGIAPNVTILPIRCFTGTPNHLGGYTSNVISGIDYAVANGADIINMSWGFTKDSSALRTTITRAANAGCILVAAAGNSGSATLQYPAAYDNVIGVGSTNFYGALSDFSQRNASVAICAPGGANSDGVSTHVIHSLWYTDETSMGKGVGTSYSAPVVVGAAALLKERDPAMTQADFLALLRDNSAPVSTAKPTDQAYVGYGLLDLKRILDATGHTSSILRYGDDGTVTVRAAHYPRAADSPGQNSLVMVGAYNPEGHLLDSCAATLDRASGYGAWSFCATFQVPDAAWLRSFFLDNATLNALAAPKESSILR